MDVGLADIVCEVVTVSVTVTEAVTLGLLVELCDDVSSCVPVENWDCVDVSEEVCDCVGLIESEAVCDGVRVGDIDWLDD